MIPRLANALIASGYLAVELTISGAVKLQKEREKAKKERKKEKKRERKEKKDRSRGEKEKTEDRKLGHKKRHHEKLSLSSREAGYHIKARLDESEQLEKSSLTEEQGCSAAVLSLYDSPESVQNSSKIHNHEYIGDPAVVQSLCDFRGSTQNSSKRSKHESAEVGRTRTTQGNGLRIRLPLLRHKDLEPAISSDQPKVAIPSDQPCFSGRTETVLTQEEATLSRRQEAPCSAEQPCFSGRIDTTPSEGSREITDVRPVSVESDRSHRTHRSVRGSSSRDLGRLYKKLIMEWKPPPLQTENLEVDDEAWLFGRTNRRHPGRCETKGPAAGEDDLKSALCSWPPRARYLPEVGIHALPYVVPF